MQGWKEGPGLMENLERPAMWRTAWMTRVLPRSKVCESVALTTGPSYPWFVPSCVLRVFCNAEGGGGQGASLLGILAMPSTGCGATVARQRGTCKGVGVRGGVVCKCFPIVSALTPLLNLSQPICLGLCPRGRAH